MALAHAVIDQWVVGIVTAHGASLASVENRRPSAAFAVLCARTLLDRGDHEILPYLTDGADDCGVDVFFIHGRDEQQYTLPVTLFSAKYSQAGNRERKEFPKNEIDKLIGLIRNAFDPGATLPANATLQALLAEVHSHIAEGYVPQVRVVACSTGRGWDAKAQLDIDEADLAGVTWEHVGPEDLLALRRGSSPIAAMLPLVGPVRREGFGFHTSLIGRMRVRDVAELIDAHGDALIDRNVRRWLGAGNRVNRQIAATLRSPEERNHLCFLNNGLTFACSKLRHNQLQAENHVIRAEGLQLVNGAQTAYTLRHVLRTLDDPGDASVLVRLYEIDEGSDPDLIARITRATNSQSPVELHDLRANDPIQRDLEVAMAELGWTYLRKRSVNGGDPHRTVTPTEAAAAILAVIRRQPHLARFEGSKHFGPMYDRIFKRDLTAERVIEAVKLVRYFQRDERLVSWAEKHVSKPALVRPTLRRVHFGRFHLALACADEVREGASPGAGAARVQLWCARAGLTPSDSPARESAIFRRPDLVVPTETLRREYEAACRDYPDSEHRLEDDLAEGVPYYPACLLSYGRAAGLRVAT